MGNKEIILSVFFEGKTKNSLKAWIPRKLIITGSFGKLSNRSFVIIQKAW